MKHIILAAAGPIILALIGCFPGQIPFQRLSTTTSTTVSTIAPSASTSISITTTGTTTLSTSTTLTSTLTNSTTTVYTGTTTSTSCFSYESILYDFEGNTGGWTISSGSKHDSINNAYSGGSLVSDSTTAKLNSSALKVSPGVGFDIQGSGQVRAGQIEVLLSANTSFSPYAKACVNISFTAPSPSSPDLYFRAYSGSVLGESEIYRSSISTNNGQWYELCLDTVTFTDRTDVRKLEVEVYFPTGTSPTNFSTAVYIDKMELKKPILSCVRTLTTNTATTNTLTTTTTCATIDIAAVPAEDGYVSTSGSVQSSSNITSVGDDASDEQVKSFFSFDISTIPSSAIISDATMYVYKLSSNGFPNSISSTINVDHIFYGTLDDSDFNLGALESNFFSFGSGSGSPNGYIEINAISQVQSDVTSFKPRSQYRFYQSTASNNDGVSDIDRFRPGDNSTEKPYLKVRYCY